MSRDRLTPHTLSPLLASSRRASCFFLFALIGSVKSPSSLPSACSALSSSIDYTTTTMRTRHARQPLLDPHDGAASAIPNSTGLPSAKSPPAPAVKARDDDVNEGASSSAAAPAHTMDLDALPSVTLTPSMVAHLLQNIQEGSPAAAQDTAPSSSASSSSQPKRNTRRKAAVKPNELLNTDTSTSFSSAAVAGLHGQDYQPRPSHNISPSTIITTKQNTRDSEDNTADDTASLDIETKEGAAGVTRRTCSHCGRLFKRASDCRRHERIHTNDKWVDASSTLHLSII